MRENGFYWVKYRGKWTVGEWRVCWWFGKKYQMVVVANGFGYMEKDLIAHGIAVGDKIDIPEKYK